MPCQQEKWEYINTFRQCWLEALGVMMALHINTERRYGILNVHAEITEYQNSYSKN